MSRVRIQPQTDELRPVLERLLKKIGEIGGRRWWNRLLGQLEGPQVSIAERGGELNVRRLDIILSLDQQKLRLRKVNVGETEVEARLDLVFFEFAHLIRDELPIFDCFL